MYGQGAIGSVPMELKKTTKETHQPAQARLTLLQTKVLGVCI